MHLARVLENDQLHLQMCVPKGGIPAKKPRIQSLAGEMTRSGNRGKVQPRLFHRSHSAWKSRKGRGIPTFPQPRRRRARFTHKDQTRQNRELVRFLRRTRKRRPKRKPGKKRARRRRVLRSKTSARDPHQKHGLEAKTKPSTFAGWIRGPVEGFYLKSDVFGAGPSHRSWIFPRATAKEDLQTITGRTSGVRKQATGKAEEKVEIKHPPISTEFVSLSLRTKTTKAEGVRRGASSA